MSQIYNLEPPVKGKVVLHTTHGDIEIELWPKEAPKAVRNFAQLCMEGYYDGTIFHRVIKDFMIQGGDPSGSGTGGASVYGRPFKDEFHSRLKFNHRGLVACASAAGQANTNGSQFFINTERADHLDRVATIFGRVAGDTIFTVLRIAEVEVDDGDRPVDPPRVTSAEVLWPPFDDIAPRTTPAEKRAVAEAQEKQRALDDIAKRKKSGKKLNVLSFGDDEELEEESGNEGDNVQATTVRFRSAHETLQEEDARLERAEVGVHDAQVEELKARLRREQADAAANATDVASVDEAGDAEDFASVMRAKVQSRAAAAAAKGGRGRPPGAPGPTGPPVDNGHTGEQSEATPSPAQHAPSHAGTAPEAKMARLRPAKAGKGAAASRKRAQAVVDGDLMTQHQRAVAESRQRKVARDEADIDVVARMKAFRERLTQPSGPRTTEASAAPAAATADAGARPTDRADGYSGKVGEFSDSEDEDLDALRGHRLVWRADDGVADPGKRRDDADDYKVVDPLLEKGKAAFNKKAQAAKKRTNEWAGKANM